MNTQVGKWGNSLAIRIPGVCLLPVVQPEEASDLVEDVIARVRRAIVVFTPTRQDALVDIKKLVGA